MVLNRVNTCAFCSLSTVPLTWNSAARQSLFSFICNDIERFPTATILVFPNNRKVFMKELIFQSREMSLFGNINMAAVTSYENALIRRKDLSWKKESCVHKIISALNGDLSCLLRYMKSSFVGNQITDLCEKRMYKGINFRTGKSKDGNIMNTRIIKKATAPICWKATCICHVKNMN